LEPSAWALDRDATIDWGGRLRQLTGSDGSYRIEEVSAGEAQVVASTGGSNPAGEFWMSRTILVPEGGEVACDFSVREGRITGRVSEGTTGRPVPGVYVFAQGERKGDEPALRHAAQGRSGEDGRYSIACLPPGRYRFTARLDPLEARAGFEDLAPFVRPSVDVTEESPAVVNISLLRGGTALVEVRDSQGKPVSGVRVRFASAPGGTEPEEVGGWARTDLMGLARARGLAPGLYYAAVIDTRYAPSCSEEQEVRAGTETRFRIDLREGVRVRIRTVDEGGAPVAWASITLLDTRGRSFPGGAPTAADAKPEDRGWSVAMLHPGEYRARGTAPGYREATVEFAVGAGSSPDVEVRLQRGRASR
ncbi:MAG: carboxypeptidase regulatory-like domain-containing protein, partial [Planctomycetota bacterium]